MDVVDSGFWRFHKVFYKKFIWVNHNGFEFHRVYYKKPYSFLSFIQIYNPLNTKVKGVYQSTSTIYRPKDT